METLSLVVCESVAPIEEAQSTLSSIITTRLNYVTVEEEKQICQQFQGHSWRRNSQVMWSGMQREFAQRWADEHDMQTLTTVMGPLMRPKDPLCRKEKKSPKEWSQYIKGASALFAWHISSGDRVTVLLPPPPGRFHPSGETNFQGIEEPILKGEIGGRAVKRIELVHPTVKGAESFRYQFWPLDETKVWIATFGASIPRPLWRKIRISLEVLNIKKLVNAVLQSDCGERPVILKRASEERVASLAKKKKKKPGRPSTDKGKNATNDKAPNENEMTLMNREKASEIREIALEEKEKALKKKQEAIEEREHSLKDEEARLNDKRRSLRNRGKELTDKEEELEKMLKEKSKAFNRMEKLLDEKSKAFNRMEQSLNDREKVLKAKEKALKDWDTMLKDKEKTLQSSNASKTSKEPKTSETSKTSEALKISKASKTNTASKASKALKKTLCK